MQTIAFMLWRRLGTPGHDVCRLDRNGENFQLDGAAAFRNEDGRLAQLHYRVRCDRAWHTQWATVRGWLGGEAIDMSIVRDAHGGLARIVEERDALVWTAQHVREVGPLVASGAAGLVAEQEAAAVGSLSIEAAFRRLRRAQAQLIVQ